MKRKLTPADVLAAAIELLDDVGLDALTVRAIAERLGVNHNAVNWHIQTKARLLTLMADQFLADCLTRPLPREWRARTKELVHRYRQALLKHRDGARVVAGVHAPLHHTLALAEAMLGALSQSGMQSDEAAKMLWVLVYFTLGITQEQQSTTDSKFSLPDAESAEKFPRVHATQILHQPLEGNFNERFEFGVDLILRSRALSPAAPGPSKPSRRNA